MQESAMLNQQNARKVAVKVLVKDDIPIFLQHAGNNSGSGMKTANFYQKSTGYYNAEPKGGDLFVYDQLNKNLTQKYPKTIQESMLSLCQQYSNSMQLFPYFNYYHPSLIAGTNLIQQEDEASSEGREQN